MLKFISFAGVMKPIVSAEPSLIDVRLLKAPAGYVIPLANYHATVGQKVTLTIPQLAHLTKVSSDQYDPNLLAADTAFRNDPKRLWLPSAESKYREGVARLRAYVAALDRGTGRTSQPG